MNDSKYSIINNKRLPVVAIVGRPNVGKSTLFNRLIKKRRAITDSMPGVTRDPIPEQWMLNDKPVLLVDTGGVQQSEKGIDALVTKKSFEVLEQADVIVFLMDVTEVTPEDELMIDRMRPYSDKILLTVNKIDTPKRDELLWDYYAFGFSKVVGISSAHGLGIDDLEEALEEMIDFSQYGSEAASESVDIRVAILGKPNTGKSTLTNYLVGKETSLVSDIPGTTRDVIIGDFAYKGASYTVLDTAGIRRKKKVEEDIEYYSVNRAIASIEDSDIVLLMVDAAEGLAEQDKKIANLIVNKGKGVILVLSKWDLVQDIPNQIEAIKDRVKFLFPILDFAPIIPICGMTGQGVEDLLDTVWKVWTQLNKRIETAQFNNALADWAERVQPPRGKKGHFKIYYGTQPQAKPVEFLLFVNRSKGFPDSYLSYIKNNIRKELGFSSIPIKIDLKERSRKS